MTQIEYLVIEHYDNDGFSEPFEPFGYERIAADQPPKIGDVVMLHWLDGSEAYRVRVERVDDMTLHVRSVS